MHLLGRELLGVEAVTSRYPQFCRPCAEASTLQLPPATSVDGQLVTELGGGPRRYSPTFIYQFPKAALGRVEVLANGGILIDRKFIPNTGVGYQRASVFASIQPSFRTSRHESIIVAPWPHYMDVTYGDFLLFVLPRICRVLNGLTVEEKSRAVLAYPLTKAPWETDYLGKLGFQPEQLVDTRKCKIKPTADGVIFAPSGEELAWVGCGAHPADYAAARTALWKRPLDTPPTRRVYLQRNARRRILNEPELLAVLKPYGFETVDLGNHTISDQMAIVADAAIILGAQGANMNSMLWSPPGATVVELFNRGFRPTYNYQMAYNIGLNYRYLAEQPLMPYDFAHLNLDITADTGALGQFLARHFA